MAFQIKGLDLNPNAGNSWMGLTREQSRFLANIFIFSGIWLTVSTFFPDPTDFAVMYVSKWMEVQFKITLELSYILLHTIFAWILLLVGIWIYPYSTHMLLNGYIKKAKDGLKDMVKEPFKLILGLAVAFAMFLWFKYQFDTQKTFEVLQEALITIPTKNTLWYIIGILIVIYLISKDKR